MQGEHWAGGAHADAGAGAGVPSPCTPRYSVLRGKFPPRDTHGRDGGRERGTGLDMEHRWRGAVGH